MRDALTFTSFADFKRKIKPGMTFKVTNFHRPEASGSRRIRSVQTNAISCYVDGGPMEPLWAYYPKSAKQIAVDGGAVSWLDGSGAVLWTYYDFSEVAP
jgi:hypothetical protein